MTFGNRKSRSGRTALYTFERLRARCAAVLVCFMVLGAAAVLAQSGAGYIQGTVTDPSGAIIPGAKVDVENHATGVHATSTTNSAGYYEVPELFAGHYDVKITAPGMKTYVHPLDLLVDQHAVINAKLALGSASEVVTVVGNAVQLTTTDSGTIESTLDNQRIQQLPENSRELLLLAAETTPGMDNVPTTNAGQPGQRANGLMPEALEYVADGVSVTNRNFGGENNSTQATLPDPDSIDQVQFELTDTPAQYATPGTAVITTKAGTNRFHGSLFETAVNNYFGISKTRNEQSNYVAPQYIRNEFGISGGGPVIIPRLYDGRNRTFFFVAYERYSLSSVTPETVAVPSAQMRTGDFSQLLSIGNPVQLYDPATTASSPACAGTTGTASSLWCRSTFSGDKIDPSRMSPLAKKLYDITPSPTFSTINPFVSGNLSAPNKAYVVVPTVSWRLDQHFNENDKAYLRFTYNNQLNRALRNYPSNSPATIAADGFPDAASGYQVIPVTNIATALGYTHIFSPTFFAETVVSQQWFYQYVGGGGNPNLNYSTMLGLPDNFGETGFPVINGLSTMSYGGTEYNYQENQIVSQIDENLTKTVGKHQMQFGGRFRHERFYYLNDRNADTVSFGAGETTGLYDPGTTSPAKALLGQGTAAAHSGNADADLFLGGAYLYSSQFEPPPSWFRDMEMDAYFQDNFHVSQKLTVNLGLRYEAHPAKQTRGNIDETFDLAHDAIVTGTPVQQLLSQGYTTQAILTNLANIGVKFETPQEAGFPSALYENANINFSPRVAFAYQPFGTAKGTVIRGGYGRYIYPIPVRNSNPGPKSVPFAVGYTQDYRQAGSSPDGMPNYNLREVYNTASNPNAIVAGSNSGSVVNSGTITSITPGSFAPTFFAPDYKPDQVTEVNATVEQSLPWNSALRVSWVYTHGSYLDHAYYPNTALPKFVWQETTGTEPPAGTTPGLSTYAITALNPYDNISYGNFIYDEKTGWSNDNELQVNYQRLYHHGFGYQIFWVYSRAFRFGGNSTRDGLVYPTQDFLGTAPIASGVTVTSPYTITPAGTPPARPSNIAAYQDYKELDRWEDYKLDSAVPTHHIGFNYIFDLPFGKNHKFFSGAPRWVDELIGGYQIAGVGYVLTQMFAPAATNWGATAPIKVYKHGAPITDCRTGTCFKTYLWWNGYIAPKSIAGPNCATNCVSGLPSDYVPYESPINTNVADTVNYNTNNVTIKGGTGLSATGETTTYATGGTGANLYSKTFINGPINWNSDISLFKVFPVTASTSFRVNLDVFNFLNHQGYPNPNATDGTAPYIPGGASGATSYNPARQIQLTLRFSF